MEYLGGARDKRGGGEGRGRRFYEGGFKSGFGKSYCE